MKKIILALTCVFLLFSIIPSVASAETSNETTDAEACQNPYTKELQDKINDFEKKDASIVESYAMGIFESILNMFNLNTINRLVMGNPYCIWFENGEDSEAGLVYGLYPAELKEKVVDPAFSMFSSVYIAMMALAILILGLRKAYSFMGISSIKFGEELMMYTMASVCMVFYFFGVEWIFLINWNIVATVKDMLQAQGIGTEFGFLMSDNIIKAKTLEFSDILFLYAEWILLLFLNFVYILRLFTITILLILGGLAIISLLFEKTRHFFKIWFITFLGNVFIQSIHAIYLAIILLFFSLDSSGMVFKFMLLILFLPMSSMMMTWLGMADGLINTKVAQDFTNKAGTAVAMAKRGNSFVNSRKGMPTADKLGKTRISTLATKDGALNAVKNVAGAANSAMGATAGLVIGPGGAMLGGMAGGAIARTAIQAPRNVIAGAKGIKSTLNKAKSEGFSMSNLSDRRQFFGNMGESIGTVVGKGELGRSFGQGLSGVSRQRLLNSSDPGGFGGVTINDVAAKYPGAKIQFQQTNEGSGFYLEENGEMKPVSPIGHADTSLKDGETRYVDFEARPSDFTQGTNGQYTPNLNQNSDSPLARVSDAYFLDNSGNQFMDRASDASKLNPMDYYRAGMENTEQRSISDHIADRMPFARNNS